MLNEEIIEEFNFYQNLYTNETLCGIWEDNKKIRRGWYIDNSFSKRYQETHRDKRFNKDRKITGKENQILELANQGLSSIKIQKLLGIGRNRICRFLKRQGWKLGKGKRLIPGE